jgi:hypothetical protein
MSLDATPGMLKLLLRQRVIVADGLVFDAEREVALPIAPFVGLLLYNTHWRPPDCDESEEPIEKIAYDLKTGHLVCYLPDDDYRPESSGSDDWTEQEVGEYYRDWVLQPDNRLQAASGQPECN